MIILCAVESKQVDKALPLCVRVFPSVSPSLVMSSLKQKQKTQQHRWETVLRL